MLYYCTSKFPDIRDIMCNHTEHKWILFLIESIQGQIWELAIQFEIPWDSKRSCHILFESMILVEGHGGVWSIDWLKISHLVGWKFLNFFGKILGIVMKNCWNLQYYYWLTFITLVSPDFMKKISNPLPRVF